MSIDEHPHEAKMDSQGIAVGGDLHVKKSVALDITKSVGNGIAMHLESVVTGMGVTDLEEPEITPIRTRSPPMVTGRWKESDGDMLANESEAERGRVQAVKASVGLAARAAKKRRRNKKKPLSIMNGVRAFAASESGTEDSDSALDTPRGLSPLPRLPQLAGATLGSRPASPGISNLKAQLDALALASGETSRSTSRARSKLGSESPSSTASDHLPEASEDMVSYEIPIDQDFADINLDGAQDVSSTSASTLRADPDQRATSMIVRKMTAADFTPLKCLGTGAFGTVLLVRQNGTGKLFAQKQLTKASLTVQKKRVEMTKSERSILELVNRHPFIVNLYYAFQDREKLYLILEYAQGGELFRHLEQEKMLPEDTAAFYMAEIVMALDYLHNTVGVIYRDLKPENCLLDSEGHLLLTDFGLSKVAVRDPATPGGSRCNSLGVGTIEYMAPEIIRGSEISDLGPGYGVACDWWSLGAMGCDLMTGKPPFPGNSITKMQQNILSQKLKLPYYLSPDAKDLLTRLLRKEPSKRLGVGKHDIQTIKKHRFFRKIDWKQLENRELLPPIVPVITNPELAENFAKEFTQKAMDDDSKHSRTLSKSDPFGGFSFVASHSLLEPGLLGEHDEAVDDDELIRDEVDAETELADLPL